MAEPPRRSATLARRPDAGGYVVRDANGQTLAFICSRDNEDEAPGEGAHEGRGTTDRNQYRALPELPVLLGRASCEPAENALSITGVAGLAEVRTRTVPR
jgi:hypothetical protein